MISNHYLRGACAVLLAGIAISSGTVHGADKKKVVFFTGDRSHGYMGHEHRAGSIILADALEATDLPIETEVIGPGWPDDMTVLDEADTIVVYCTGGGSHLLLEDTDRVAKWMAEGKGLINLHYAVEVPSGKPGELFLDWVGGYFETFWSVNPHWTANFDALPDHPIARGVEPFEINDEWYYHMRFRSEMEGVTPILSAMPPPETLSRPDGPHSGNRHVREAVLERNERQHVAWASERANGGRGFGFTGGHHHWNWAHPEFRQTVLNAIVWVSGLEVPENGVPSEKVDFETIMANPDYDRPENWRPGDSRYDSVADLIAEWNAAEE